jgi:hypothetical protein
LKACGDPPDRWAGLRKILDGAARAGMIRVNRAKAPWRALASAKGGP